MEPKTDREHLLVLGTKFDLQMALLEKHVIESKETSERVLGTLQNHSDRLLTIENKKKTSLGKFFKFVFGFLISKP